MSVHHVALRSPDPAGLAAFYARVLDLPERRRADDAEGLFSVWLDLGGTLLMVERGQRRSRDEGWDGVFLTAEAGAGERWLASWRALGIEPEGRTAYTLYARDPEGNRFGVSSYPEALF